MLGDFGIVPTAGMGKETGTERCPMDGRPSGRVVAAPIRCGNPRNGQHRVGILSRKKCQVGLASVSGDAHLRSAE